MLIASGVKNNVAIGWEVIRQAEIVVKEQHYETSLKWTKLQSPSKHLKDLKVTVSAKALMMSKNIHGTTSNHVV